MMPDKSSRHKVFTVSHSVQECAKKLQKFEQDQIFRNGDAMFKGYRTFIEIWSNDEKTYGFEMRRAPAVFNWFPLVSIYGDLTMQDETQTQVRYELRYNWMESSVIFFLMLSVLVLLTIISFPSASTPSLLAGLMFLLPIWLIFGLLQGVILKYVAANFTQRQLRYILTSE